MYKIGRINDETPIQVSKGIWDKIYTKKDVLRWENTKSNQKHDRIVLGYVGAEIGMYYGEAMPKRNINGERWNIENK
jgi:hypothetical protein